MRYERLPHYRRDRPIEQIKGKYLYGGHAKSTDGNIDLVAEMQKSQMICLRMPETMFSTDGERDVYTTYWMTKLWMALQIREQKVGNRSKLVKVNIVVDELYQVENTQKFLSDKLSRLAKFGAKPIISCHYINQISHIRTELRSANASYMLICGCDKKNYVNNHGSLSTLLTEKHFQLCKAPSTMK